MALPTGVSPDHLQSTSAQMCMNQAAITSVVAGAAPATCPAPAAFDEASAIGAQCFEAYSGTYMDIMKSGLTNMLHGATVLVPVSADYQNTDIADGQVVRVCTPI